MHNEQVFTPKNVVKRMLKEIGYGVDGCDILHKHIIDNSCGDGAFLVEIVKLYLNSCIINNVYKEMAKVNLETYIHGIEIDYNLYKNTLKNLDEVAEQYSIYKVNWDVINADAMDCSFFNGKMDYVIGNPPYCNVHHLKNKYDKVKKYKFANGGMTDLYLVFFEIGLNMLNENGILSYITPNSWLTSIAGNNFRRYLVDTNKLKSIVQYGHEKIFNNATTFCTITNLINNKTDDSFILYEDGKKILLNLSQCILDGKLYLQDRNMMNMLVNINNETQNKRIHVKNGFATLNDKMFVMNDAEICNFIFDRHIIKTIKASKAEYCYLIFPYNENGKPVDFNDLSNHVKEHLLNYAEKHNIDTTNRNWYLYGRTQAINDVWKFRYSINNLIRNKEDIKIRLLLPDYGIYSGYYIYSDDINLTEDLLKEALMTDEFETYVKIIGKHKNGGYYTFSSKELEKYLNYYFNKY